MAAKRVLVTGASGFIGEPLVRALASRGYTVRAAARRPMSFPDGIDKVIITNFEGPVDWGRILRGIDIVIHTAGLAHTIYPNMGLDTFDHINRKTTEDFARAAARAGVERFVYISSVRAQTGSSMTNVVRERDQAHPTNRYGHSKLAAETALCAAGVPFTILRPVVVYGPHPKGNIKAVLRLAASPWLLPFGGLKSRRSLLGIDNLISAILFVLKNPATLGEIFLVADPNPVSVRELFAMLRKAQGRRPGLINIPPWFLRIALILVYRKRVWDRLGNELVVDTTKLQTLGWRPVVGTFEGLRAALYAENDKGLSENATPATAKWLPEID